MELFMRHITKLFAIFAASGLLLLSFFLAGCGDGRPRRVPVAGHVLIDGKPLTDGFIQVSPADGRPASGKIGPDGHFALTTFDANDGCMLGKHRVKVIGSKQLNVQTVQWLAPRKYSDETTSGLELEVTGPTDSVEFKLTWDGGKPFVETLDIGDEKMPKFRQKK
jgi:hypothetical protein